MSIGYFKRRRDLPVLQSCDLTWEQIRNYVLGLPQYDEQPSGVELPWDLNPPYQRDSVWTVQQQEDFIGHCLGGGIRPMIYVQQWDLGSPNLPPGVNSICDTRNEVVDGKQRIEAMLAFIRGDIASNTWHDGKVHRYRWEDLSRGERGMGGPTREKIGFMDCSLEQRVNWYLRINGGGTPHTSDDLEKARALLGGSGAS